MPLKVGAKDVANGGPGVSVGTCMNQLANQRPHTDIAYARQNRTHLVGLETSDSQRPQMRAVRMAGKKRLREHDHTVDYLLFVHVAMCRPDFGLDQC